MPVKAPAATLTGAKRRPTERRLLWIDAAVTQHADAGVHRRVEWRNRRSGLSIGGEQRGQRAQAQVAAAAAMAEALHSGRTPRGSRRRLGARVPCGRAAGSDVEVKTTIKPLQALAGREGLVGSDDCAALGRRAPWAGFVRDADRGGGPPRVPGGLKVRLSTGPDEASVPGGASPGVRRLQSTWGRSALKGRSKCIIRRQRGREPARRGCPRGR